MEEKFLEIFGIKSEKKYFSPGRVNLIGEHIDYNGGMVLPMAINLGTYGLIRERSDNRVRVYSQNFEEVGVIEFDIETIKYDEKYDWANYVQGVIDIFQKAGYQINNGFDLLIQGTVPNGSGLSSSASLEVLIGTILIDMNKLDIDGIMLAKLAKKAENDFIGVNCGIMDQFIIANGTEKGALCINTQTLEFDTVPINLGANEVVVLNSNKQRGLVDSCYNERRLSCERAVSLAKENYGVDYLCEMTIDQLNGLRLDKEDYKRAKHAIEEQVRVEKSIEQLSEGDIFGFGQTLYEGHESLKNLFEVSCEELDFLVEGCRKLGAVGARMTGAGFGGCLIAIMPKGKVDNLDSLAVDYVQQYGRDLDYYQVQASDKAQSVDGERI